MMSGISFSRLYRRIVGDALTPLGFQRSGSRYFRVKNRLVHGISLHKSDPWSFTGEFAVQPLVYPCEGFILDFGDRVDEVGPERKSWWKISTDRTSMAETIQEYTEVLIKFVLPWLDRFQTCSDVVETDVKKRWGIWRLDTPTKSKDAIMIGLCALASEMTEPAQKYLELAQREYRRFVDPESSDWAQADLQLVEQYLELLSLGDWDSIRAKLAEGEMFTRKSLGLPPPDSD